MEMLVTPTSERQFIMYEALRKGASVEDACTKRPISNHGLSQQMKELVELEEEILQV